MQIEMTAKFYDSAQVPFILPSLRQVNYSINLTSFSNITSNLQGSIIAPAGVSEYTFQVTLPPNTLEASGQLLAGDFFTFPCGGPT